MSTVSKGNAWKRKTRDWYRAQGYDCEYTEVLQTIFAGPGKLFYRKNDLFASDGVAMNKTEIVFWNSKSREKDMMSDLRKFSLFKFPSFVVREIVVWVPRKKYPLRLRTVRDFYQGKTQDLVIKYGVDNVPKYIGVDN